MKKLMMVMGAACAAFGAWGAGLEISEDGTTGGLSAIRIAGDAARMNWINPADGTELARVGSQYKWGTGALTADGVRVGWTVPAEVRGETAVYRLTNGVELVRTRRATSDGFFERYAFTNRTDRTVHLAAIDIHTPFHDDYLARGSNWTQRCQSHIWAGGSTAWVCSLRMGGAAPHLGLVVTEGAVTGYSQKERGVKTFHSNFRGVLSLSPPDAALGPGQGFAVAWRVFAHNGKRDFRAKLGELGGVIAEAEDWVVTAREPAVVRFSCARAGLLDGATLRGEGVSVTSAREKGALVATCAYSADGEARVVCRLKDGRETWAELLCRRDPEALIAARAKFIVERQQVAGKSADDPYDGAFVEYDNETNAQVRRWEMPEESRPEIDHTEGAERLGMGVFLAMMAQRGHAELLPALRRYARFVREGLQEPDYTTWGEVARPTRRRHFNYPWVAWFQAEMYAATNEKRHILDAYGTMMAMYGSFRPRPSVALSADRIIELLRKAGCADEADALQAANRKFIDSIIGGADFMNGTEVGFAPELPGSMIPQLLRLWKATGEARYRDVALKDYLPMLEACMGDQPSWHSHDIGLHHWDGYWFGKRMTWGDTLPHDWNGTAVETFDLLAEATGDGTYRARARAIARQLLGLFDSDGRAGCAWILPDRVNDRPARFRDPLANDQDWALVFYLLH